MKKKLYFFKGFLYQPKWEHWDWDILHQKDWPVTGDSWVRSRVMWPRPLILITSLRCPSSSPDVTACHRCSTSCSDTCLHRPVTEDYWQGGEMVYDGELVSTSRARESGKHEYKVVWLYNCSNSTFWSFHYTPGSIKMINVLRGCCITKAHFALNLSDSSA